MHPVRHSFVTPRDKQRNGKSQQNQSISPSLEFSSRVGYLQPFTKLGFKMLGETAFTFSCMKPFSSNKLHVQKGKVYSFRIPALSFLSWHNSVHEIISVVITPNNTIVHKALCILQFVNPNYHRLITNEDLNVHFQNSIDCNILKYKRHFTSVIFISVVLCYVSTSEEKLSKLDSPTIQSLFFFSSPHPSSPPDPSFLFFCTLKTHFVLCLVNFILDW